MYTHVSKCKNHKVKNGKKINKKEQITLKKFRIQRNSN
jgi:hypothetical protein